MSVAARHTTTRGARLEQIAELVRPTARVIHWWPLLGAAVVALVQVFVQTRESCPPSSPCVGTETRALALRIAAIFLALGAAFVLDDPTDESTSHLPTPRWLRRAVRVGLVAPFVAVMWALLVALALRGSATGDPFPTNALTLELAALVLCGLAVSVASARFVPERTGGVAAGPILIGLILAGHFLPEQIGIFPLDPHGPRWHAAHEFWRALLLLGATALMIVSRDAWRTTLVGARKRLTRTLSPRGARRSP